MFQICSLGVVSQMVLRNMELGFSREQATFILSLVALIGLVGSFFVGYMDERLGTKKSMLFFGIWYALSLLANATENTVLVYVSIFMIGMSIGGSANFTTSLTTSVFGRQGFSKVNSVDFPHPRRGVRPLLRGQRRSLQHHRRQPALHLSHFCRRIRSLRAHCTASG